MAPGLMDRFSNFTAELCQHRNMTVGLPRFLVSESNLSAFRNLLHPPLRLCASARVLPIRCRSAFSYAPMGFAIDLYRFLNLFGVTST